jgi:hypothetical protein
MKKWVRYRLAIFAALLAAAGSFTVAVAPAAQADSGVGNIVSGNIVSGVGAIASYIGYAKSAYGLFNQYILGHAPPDVITSIQGAIIASQTAIINQVDGLASAQVASCADQSTLRFENIDQLDSNGRIDLANFIDSCITTAKDDIPVESSAAAIDQLGLAINTVGPMALFAQAYAGLRTDILKQYLITANQRLLSAAPLRPTCQVFIQDVFNLPNGGEGPITGYGGCYNYRVPTPTSNSGDSTTYEFPNINGDSGRLPWNVRGDAIPQTTLGVTTGYHVNWPTIGDYSIAVNEAMANTSYPVAQTSLYELQDPVTITGSAIAAGGSSAPYTPVELLRVNGDSTVSRNEVHATDNALSGWTGMDGQLASLAEAGNADGRAEMFGIDRLGDVYHRWQEAPNDDTSWSPWAQMTGQTLTSIAVARNQDGTLQVFGTTPAGQIVTRNQILGGDQYPSVQPDPLTPAVDDWTDWKPMDGQLTQVAAADANGQIELFGINSAGNVFDRQETAPNATDPTVAGSWTGWNQLDGTLTSIAVASDRGASLNLFGTDASGAVLQRYQTTPNTEQWSAWSPVPGATMSSVAAAKESFAGGHIDLFGVGPNGQISLDTNDGVHGDPWSGWSTVPDTPFVPPALVSPGDQNTSLEAWVNLVLSGSGGTAPYAFSVSGLPDGLGYSGHVISGWPSTPGTWTVSVTTTDGVGDSSTASFNWAVTGVTVPNVLYRSQADAVNLITGAGLTASVSYQKECIDPGEVLVQGPLNGDVVPPGTTVYLTVDSGTFRTCPRPS